jgi:phosphoenolpyruvate carboxykinase (GTP)
MFTVNWFRKDKNGKYIWPGYGENMRILKWIIERVNGQRRAIESPIGWMPIYEDIDWRGLDFPESTFNELMAVDREAWKAELLMHEALFSKLYDRLPREFLFLRDLILCGLWRSPGGPEPGCK